MGKMLKKEKFEAVAPDFELDAGDAIDVDLIPDGEVDVDAVALLLSAPVSPRRLAPKTRLQLAQLAEQGGILELPMEGLVYADAPNQRGWRLDRLEHWASQIGKDAKRPGRMMVNHSRSAGARIGDWTSASLEPVDGVRWMRAKGVILDPKAQASFVRGTLDRFSVALGKLTKIPHCSLCGAELKRNKRYGFLEMSCEHEMGVDGCELMVDAPIEEISFVYEGAVDGTHVASAEDVDDNETQSLLLELEQKDAELEELKTQLQSAIGEVEPLRRQLMEMHLEQAVLEGRVMPAELEHYREIWEAVGAEKCRQMLSLRGSVSVPRKAELSTPIAEPEPGAERARKPSLAEVKAGLVESYKLGFLSRIPSDEEVELLGLHKIEF